MVAQVSLDNLTGAGANPEQYELQKAVSKAQAIRELRAIQQVTLERINSSEATDKTVFEGARTYVDLREQIRIEKGIIKPGSRNISVKEESKQARKLTQFQRSTVFAVAPSPSSSPPPDSPDISVVPNP